MSENTQGPYLPRSYHTDDMNVVLEPIPSLPDPVGLPLGTSNTESIIACMPSPDEFQYDLADTIQHIRPVQSLLLPPNEPTPASPPAGKYYPASPPGGYKLLADRRYSRGYVFAASYDLKTMISEHKPRLLNIAMPPFKYSASDGPVSIPTMIRLIPGIPFVFHFNGDQSRAHTVACVQTLDSLKAYPDFDEILSCCVRLAKLTWGCPATNNSSEIKPIYALRGLKTNDRSAKRVAQQHDDFDGSYSLGNTVMKGDGLGTVLPSVQADSAEAKAQIRAVLTTLHSLRRLIMPKCLSKFENDIFDFQMDFNNVFSFGGLAPNGTSVQMNVSSVGKLLDIAIAIQGFWHTDKSDDPKFWTFFVLLFRIPPGADPGPFFIARGGVYVHELDAWIIFIVFKGTDIHSGVAPNVTKQEQDAWFKSTIDPIWTLSGPQNRVGYVGYTGEVPANRSGSLNVSLPTAFGNYGTSAVHKANQKDFARHGDVTMGSACDRAERLGREIVSNLYNSARLCNLSSTFDMDSILTSFTFTDPSSGEIKHLSPFPLHPIKQETYIRRCLALLKWHSSESHLFNLGITNTMLDAAMASSSPLPDFSKAIDLPNDHSEPLQISSVIGKHSRSGKWFLTVRLLGSDDIFNIPQTSPLLVENAIVCAWLMESMHTLSSINVSPHNSSHTCETIDNSPSLPGDATLLHCPPSLASTSSHPGITPSPNGLASLAEGLTSQSAESPCSLSGNPSYCVPELLATPVDSHEGLAPSSQHTQSAAQPRPQSTRGSTSDSCLAPEASAALTGLQNQPPAALTRLRGQSSAASTAHPSRPTAQKHPRPPSQKRQRPAPRKRPRPAESSDSESHEPSDGDSRADSEFDSEDDAGARYEIEAILKHDFSDKDNSRWFVKWLGYPDDENAWIDGSDMEGCMDILSAYTRKHGLQNFHLKAAIVTPAALKPQPIHQQHAVAEFATNLSQLHDLLDESRLDCEVSGLVFQFQQAYGGGRDYWTTNASLSSLINTWSNHYDASNYLLGALSILPSDSFHSGVIRFEQLQMSLSVLPSMASQLHKLDLVGRAYQREICRTLVTVFDWYTSSGPKFCNLLISVHQSRGYNGLKSDIPMFAELVDHVVQYAHAFVKTNAHNPTGKAQKPRKQRRLQQAPKSTPVSLQKSTKYEDFLKLASQSFGPSPNCIDKVPGNLYGVFSDGKSSSTIKLPPIRSKRLPIVKDPVRAVYQAAISCIEELLSTTIIHPYLKHVDHSISTSRSAKNIESICNRAITRGAILACLLRICESDGVFASDAMKSFLARPSQDLLPTGGQEERGASALKKNSKKLAPLLNAISTRLEEHPGIVDKVAQLGDVVDAHLQALQNGGVVDHHGVASPRIRLTTGRKINPDVLMNIDFSTLLLAIPTPKLTILAVILREALNHERKLPVADEITHRILLGCHPTQSSTVVFPPCQTNPIRKSSEYALLVQKHLPGHLLTSKAGISNLLSWMGTGQGYRTKPFLNTISRPTGFFSSDLDELLDIFRPADSANRTLALQAPATSSIQQIPGFIPCFDLLIWGQPNHLLSIHPTIIRSKSSSLISNDSQVCQTIDDKFAPYWELSVQAKWAEFLGDMLDSDPAMSSGPKKSWMAALNFFSGLGIPLFGSGLTLLQTVNNLVYANIIAMPSDTDIALWVYHNHTLGAYGGLELLGFSSLNTPMSVIYAFRSVYDHLDSFLSPSDKETLGFSPIFVEHVLCKVSRWSTRLTFRTKSANPSFTLSDLTALAETTSPPWSQGANATDHMAFPFPTTIAHHRLTAIVTELTHLHVNNA